MKGCASSGIGGCPQTATMRFHNGTTDSQPHPAALRLSGEEGRKDLVTTANRQSWPSVADRQQYLTVPQLRFHRKLSAGFIHRFNGIEHEVHEDLLQLNAVRHDFRESGGKFRSHLDGESRGLTLQQREYFVDDFVYIDQLALWRRLPVQRPDMVDDLSRTVPIFIDFGCSCPSPIKVGRFVSQPFDAAVGAGHRGRDGLLDLMCQ